MSSFSALWRRSQAISVAAKEEQERLGHPEIDIEHLFLALLIVGGAGSRVLGSLGVTLSSAREACGHVHAEQIALLGITSSRPEPATGIPDPSIGGFRWSARGAAIMRTVDLEHDDSQLLIALLEESSGHITRVLRQLSLTEAMVLSAAAECRIPDAAGEAPRSGGRNAVSFAGYVAATPSSVWDLVSDPGRRLEWDGYFYDSVEERDDGILVAEARRIRPDGKPVKVRPEFGITEFVVSRYLPERCIEWESSWPLKPGDRYRRRFAVQLEPDGSGTRVTLTQSCLTSAGLRARLLAPLLRFSIRQAHFARIDAMSRALRQ